MCKSWVVKDNNATTPLDPLVVDRMAEIGKYEIVRIDVKPPADLVTGEIPQQQVRAANAARQRAFTR